MYYRVERIYAESFHEKLFIHAAGKIATALAMTEAVLFHFLEENIIAALCTAGNVLHCGAPRKCQLCSHEGSALAV